MKGGSRPNDQSTPPHRQAPRPTVDYERLAVVRARTNRDGTVFDRLDVRPSEVATFAVAKPLLDELSRARPDVVLIDHRPNEFDLHRLCRDLSSSIRARIVVLDDHNSAREDWVLSVIDAGADDVLPYSVSRDLLHARLNVALRTAPPVRRFYNQIVIGDVRIDLDAHAVFVGDVLVECQPRAYVLLVALAARPGEVRSRDELLSEVWNSARSSADWRHLSAAAAQVRKVLGEGPRRPRLETVYSRGYRLVVGPEETGESS